MQPNYHAVALVTLPNERELAPRLARCADEAERARVSRGATTPTPNGPVLPDVWVFLPMAQSGGQSSVAPQGLGHNRGIVMNLNRYYRFLYRVGFTPWEQDTDSLAGQLGSLVTLEEARRTPPFGSALDLGCGSGRWSVELATRGWRVTGVDVVPRAVASARRRAQTAGVDLAFLVGDVTALRDAGIGSGFSFLLDVECFNHLNAAQRVAMGRGRHQDLRPLAHQAARMGTGAAWRTNPGDGPARARPRAADLEPARLLAVLGPTAHQPGKGRGRLGGLEGGEVVACPLDEGHPRRGQPVPKEPKTLGENGRAVGAAYPPNRHGDLLYRTRIGRP